jgi:nitrogen regulatory protein PII
MKLITAIVRTTRLEDVVRAFAQVGIKGMTISKIKGLGEEVRLYNPYTIHDKIEIIVPDDAAGKVVAVLLEHSRVGMPGDGVITVQTLDYAVKIRTEEKLK